MWLFTPLARFADFEALNEWLAMRCRELAQRKHLVTPDRLIADCFAEEQPALLETLEVACELVLGGNVITASVVINEMRRLIAPLQPPTMSVPDMLKLTIEPLADCGRYDRLRGVSHVIH